MKLAYKTCELDAVNLPLPRRFGAVLLARGREAIARAVAHALDSDTPVGPQPWHKTLHPAYGLRYFHASQGRWSVTRLYYDLAAAADAYVKLGVDDDVLAVVILEWPSRTTLWCDWFDRCSADVAQGGQHARA